MEVDASEVGVGAILSQHFGEKPKLDRVAFFSMKLPPTEQNYDVGNRELLAIKQALVTLGATFPFTIFTDHKNPEYLRSAKRLNACQARWAPNKLLEDLETILPPTCFINNLTWEMEGYTENLT